MDHSPKTADQAASRMDAAIAADVPHLYGSSFVGRFSGKDFILAIELNTRPVATLNISLPDIKILAEALTHIAASYERVTGRTIPTDAELLDILNCMDGPNRSYA